MVRVPSKPDKNEVKFGLAAPLDGEVERFAHAQRREAEEKNVSDTDLIPDGQCELALFKEAEIRKVFHSGEWWFSVIDVIAALTKSPRARKYWSDLKKQLSEKEGFSELSDSIGQLPMPGSDGKMYPTDVANTETVLRLIQSVQSPRAEPFKRWLAKVGYERIKEIQDPEIAIKRAILTYQIQGHSDEWIEKRIRSIVVRKDLTDEWKERGIQGDEYGILTNVISTATYGGVTVEGHKRMKGLKPSHNLRDHMSDLELIFTMLGEKSTTEIARSRDAQGYTQNLGAAKAGGIVAGSARRQLEMETGHPVLSKTNFLGQVRRESDPQRLTLKKK
jgi:DNA-damage-inducible protein D